MSRLQKELARLAPWGWDPHVKQHPPGSAFQKDFSHVAFAREMLRKEDSEEGGNEKRKRSVSPSPPSPSLVTPGRTTELVGILSTSNTKAGNVTCTMGGIGSIAEGEELQTPEIAQCQRRKLSNSISRDRETLDEHTEEPGKDGPKMNEVLSRQGTNKRMPASRKALTIKENPRDASEDVVTNLLDEFDTVASKTNAELQPSPLVDVSMAEEGLARIDGLPPVQCPNKMQGEIPQTIIKPISSKSEGPEKMKENLSAEQTTRGHIEADGSEKTRKSLQQTGKLKLIVRGPHLRPPLHEKVNVHKAKLARPSDTVSSDMYLGKENAPPPSRGFVPCRPMVAAKASGIAVPEQNKDNYVHKIYRPQPRVGRIEVVDKEVAILHVAKTLVVPGNVTAAAKANNGSFQKGCAILHAMDANAGWKH